MTTARRRERASFRWSSSTDGQGNVAIRPGAIPRSRPWPWPAASGSPGSAWSSTPRRAGSALAWPPDRPGLGADLTLDDLNGPRLPEAVRGPVRLDRLIRVPDSILKIC
ncbi:MAG: hypothetical protein WKF75_12245 [Singulisphaera sp.]